MIRSTFTRFVTLTALLALDPSRGAVAAQVQATAAIATEASAVRQNPLLAPWPGPLGGVPPFDAIRTEHFSAALATALDERRRDVAAIVARKERADFSNTIEALERVGATYNRVLAMFGLFSNNLKDEAFAAVEREWAPRLAAANDEILLDSALFARVKAVWEAPAAERARLTNEQRRLLWRTYDTFTRFGANLDATQKVRLSAIHQELATLYAEFNQKVQADENSWIVLESAADLAGLPPGVIAGLEAAANERGLSGRWAVVNTRSMVDPFLTYADRRDLRARVWRAFKGRGDDGDANDTNATIARILPLRAEKARLLGHGSFAEWKLSNTMAGTPERAQALLDRVWPPARERVREEVADLAALARHQDPEFTIQPWDYLYYAEKVRKAKFDVDQNELKPYFELEKMIEASFWMANRLYGFSFAEITGKVPVFHPDVRVWEVRGRGDRVIGLFYGDYFARAGKNSGAWETAYRSQGRLDRENLPLVSNNNNFVKGRPGEPVLISLDDARVLFHEFGHALHDLLSNVTYSSLSGTNTAQDFGEVPSQIHEHWLMTPEILDRFALHYQTGAKMPRELIEKVKRSSTFNQGYVTVEYLSSALVDMDLHRRPDGRVDPKVFEREALARIDMPREIAMRHRLPQFTHLFDNDGYAAGYYSYLWSETMDADAWLAFEESGDVWSPEVAARLAAMMSAGDSVDQAELYRRFRGRDPDVSALLRQRGFPVR